MMPSDERSRLGASGFGIRELNEADLSLIADLTRRAFSTPHVPSPGLPAPGATHETREGIVKELRAGTRVFVLYLGPGTGQDGNGLGPAGIVRVTPRPPDAWVLSRFGVLPEFRGRGAGTLLLSSIEKQARDAGVRRLVLYCVVERLLVPHYQQRGFRVTAIAPHTEKPLTVATMEKDIGQDSCKENCGDSLTRVTRATPDADVTPEWGALPQRGLYVLWLYVPEPSVVRIGSLGEHSLDRGLYAYVGSGAKGLPHRLRRHWTGGGSRRWHVDWLRAVARPVGIDVVPIVSREVEASSVVSLPTLSECELADSLCKVSGVTRLIPRFGASDCGCAGHLFSVPRTSTAHSLPRSWQDSLLCCYPSAFRKSEIPQRLVFLLRKPNIRELVLRHWPSPHPHDITLPR